MNTKYVIALSVLVMGIYGNIFGFSNADRVKASDSAPKLLEEWSSQKTMFLPTALVLSDLLHGNGLKKPDNPDKLGINLLRHFLWYNEHDPKCCVWSHERKPGADIKCEFSHLMGYGTFIAADYVLGEAANKLGENESVKNVVKWIPEQHRSFVYQNGKMVVTSAAARTIGTLAKDGKPGMNWDNAKKFGKAVVIQVGTEGLDQYVVNPSTDLVCEKLGCEKDSMGSNVVKLGLTYVAYMALNTAVGK